MLVKLEIIINGAHSLFLPAEGVDIKLINNEFNLLTNSVEDMRPLSILQAFEIPLDENRRIFEELANTEKRCEVKYNDITIIAGPIYEYSADEQTKQVSITVVSAFKEVVDAMGDNVMYLDTIDLSSLDYRVEDTAPPITEGLLRTARYNPMDTSTGRLVYDDNTAFEYTKPSLKVKSYFFNLFARLGWSGNWDALSGELDNLLLLPTTPKYMSSFGFRFPRDYTVGAGARLRLPLDESGVHYNYWNGDYPAFEYMPNQEIQPRHPARNTQFCIRAEHNSDEAFEIVLTESNGADSIEMARIQCLGTQKINFRSDLFQLKQGINPLRLELHNPNPYPITVDFSRFDFYNLFSIYETNEDEFLNPIGYRYKVADNLPNITPLELYREMLVLFQVAQSTNDAKKDVDWYFINDIPKKGLERVDVNPFILWDGYVALSDEIDGLSKLNAIRYLNDVNKQRYFKVDLTSLPASGVYFESMFAATAYNQEWGAALMPSLEYKTKKLTDTIVVEYLEYKDIPPQLGIYDNSDPDNPIVSSHELQMPNIINKYWSHMLTYLSSTPKRNPTVFQLNMRLFYWQYKELMKQRNLFFYTSDALLIGGEYDVIAQTFTGTFLALR